jgi:hypothetical protein
VDVNAKEERLCSSRLSIAMNSYEDFCGMSTLGALNLGGKADSDESVIEGKSLENVNQ